MKKDYKNIYNKSMNDIYYNDFESAYLEYYNRFFTYTLLKKNLNLKPFKVVADSKKLLGYYTPATRTVHIKPHLSRNDYFFVLAHESRHIYQLDTNRYKKTYIMRHNTDLKNYNEQKPELEANAYAYAMCYIFLKNLPTFEGLEESTRLKIIHWAEAIFLRENYTREELCDEYLPLRQKVFGY